MLYTTVTVISLLLPPPFQGADAHCASDGAKRLKEVKTQLAEAGVKVSATYVALACESNLRSGLSKTSKLNRSLIKSNKETAAAEAHVERNQQAITQLTQANVQLNARLAQVRAGDVTMNNKLVGMINTNVSQLELLHTQKQRMKEGMQKVRQSANQVREDYVSHVLSLREIAEAVQADYATKSQDADLKALIDEAASLTGRQFELKESRSFQSALKKLAKLEETVLTGSIALRKDSDTFYASVVVNGIAREMIVDSGASMITLPWTVAKALNVKVKPSDKPIKLVMADGREISATLVVLESVRVGPFTVAGAEAAVLGPEATFAAPLLGMSYLKNFKFEIKPVEAVMTLVRVGNGNQKKPKPRSR